MKKIGFVFALLVCAPAVFADDAATAAVAADTAVAGVPAADVLSSTEAAELSAMPLDKLLKRGRIKKGEGKSQWQMADIIRKRIPATKKEIEALCDTLSSSPDTAEGNDPVGFAAATALENVSDPAMAPIFATMVKHGHVYCRAAGHTCPVKMQGGTLRLVELFC